MKVLKFSTLTDKLQKDWANLWEKSANANIVNSPFWFIASEKAFDREPTVILALYDDTENELFAIVAFIKEKIFGVSIWTAPGREFADKPMILADYEDQNTMNILFKEILKLGNVLLTEYTHDQVKKTQPHARGMTAWKNDLNPYIIFQNGKYDYPNRRKNYLLNRLESTKVHARLQTTTNEASKEALELCFDIEKASSKQQNGKGIFYRQEVREFYKTLVLLAPENIPISIMYLDNKPISYLIGFLTKGVYQTAQKACLTGYEYYNPGKLQMLKILDYCLEKGNLAIDLGRGYDRFKQDITKMYYELYNLILSPNPFIRLYIVIMFKTRNKIYDLISRYALIYRLFKKLKGIIQPSF